MPRRESTMGINESNILEQPLLDRGSVPITDISLRQGRRRVQSSMCGPTPQSAQRFSETISKSRFSLNLKIIKFSRQRTKTEWECGEPVPHTTPRHFISAFFLHSAILSIVHALPARTILDAGLLISIFVMLRA